MTDATDETEVVLTIERGFWTSADDPAFYEENIAAGGISVIEPMGVVEKDRAVQMAGSEPWQDVEMTDLIAREVAPNVIIVAYHGKGTHAGDEEPYRTSIASTYVRLDGRWQLALTAHQPWTPK